MIDKFLDPSVLNGFDANAFIGRSPYPWFNFHKLLTDEGFATLYRDFPSLAQFEKHAGIERTYGQRPHNRYYLAFAKSIYHDTKTPSNGVVGPEDLTPTWQAFINELNTSPVYADFIRRTLGMEQFDIRMAWHVGENGSEVSPHRDADAKVGTHIFYFNTSSDWDAAWGGETLVLGGKTKPVDNPDFGDFKTEIASRIVDNHSFLFKNTSEAWHGVKPLVAPPGKYRRLFNVIIEHPGVRKSDEKAAEAKKGLFGRIAARFGK